MGQSNTATKAQGVIYPQVHLRPVDHDSPTCPHPETCRPLSSGRPAVESFTLTVSSKIRTLFSVFFPHAPKHRDPSILCRVL